MGKLTLKTTQIKKRKPVSEIKYSPKHLPCPQINSVIPIFIHLRFLYFMLSRL